MRQEKVEYHVSFLIKSIKRTMIKSLEKNKSKITLGYIKNCSGHWVTSAPTGYKYDNKNKVWIITGDK